MKTRKIPNKKRMISVLVMLCMAIAILSITAFATTLPDFAVQPTDAVGSVGSYVSIPFELEKHNLGVGFWLERMSDIGEWETEIAISHPKSVRIAVKNPAKKYRIKADFFNLGEVIYSNEFTVSPSFRVTINSSDANVIRDDTTGSETQTGVTGAMQGVVYTANTGYYFPLDYGFSKNGIIVSRNSDMQITVNGTPTSDTTITLTPATKAEDVVILTQPQSVTLEDCSDLATFSVEINETPYDTYKWQIYYNNFWFDMEQLAELNLLSVTGLNTKEITVDLTNSSGTIVPMTLKCVVTRAGVQYSSEITWLNAVHNFDEYIQNNATTHKAICSLCGAEKLENHIKKWISDDEATTTQSGVRHYICPKCGYESEMTAYLVGTNSRAATVVLYENKKANETTALTAFTVAENSYRLPYRGTLKNSGYIFQGWALSPDEKVPVWLPDEKMLVPAGETKLYAVWEKASITLTSEAVVIKSDVSYNNAIVIMAAYAEEKLTNIWFKTIDIAGGTVTDLDYSDFDYGDADVVKVMAFKDFTSMKPLFDVYTEILKY